MSVVLRCPHCSARITIRGGVPNKSVCCPRCAADFDPPSDFDFDPAARRLPPSRSNKLVWVCVSLGAALLALGMLACAGLVFLGTLPVDRPPSDATTPDPVRVTIFGAHVQQAAAIGFDGHISHLRGDPSLYLYLNIENTSKSKKIDLESWIDMDGGNASLRDNLGNTYEPVRINARRLWGPITGDHFPHRAIHPGEKSQDFVLFQRPVKTASNLYLSLPKSNYGWTGNIDLVIPMRTVKGLD